MLPEVLPAHESTEVGAVPTARAWRRMYRPCFAFGGDRWEFHDQPNAGSTNPLSNYRGREDDVDDR